MRQTILLTLLLALTTGPVLAQTTVQARRASDFVYSTGVNVHLEYSGTPYQHYAGINSRLIELGMHHVRDEINDTANRQFVSELRQMKTMGYSVCGLIEGGNDYPPAGEGLESRKVVPMIQNLLPSIDAVEGPNEPDDSTTPPFTCSIHRARSTNRRTFGRSSRAIRRSAICRYSSCRKERRKTS